MGCLHHRRPAAWAFHRSNIEVADEIGHLGDTIGGTGDGSVAARACREEFFYHARACRGHPSLFMQPARREWHPGSSLPGLGIMKDGAGPVYRTGADKPGHDA
jgi:hypothetical protein